MAIEERLPQENELKDSKLKRYIDENALDKPGTFILRGLFEPGYTLRFTKSMPSSQFRLIENFRENCINYAYVTEIFY